MIAIKQSWTRSPLPFIVRIGRSSLHKRAFQCLCLVLVSTVALNGHLNIYASCLCVSITLLLFVLERRHQSQNNVTRVLSFSASGVWTYHCGDTSSSGILSRHSYRSRVFIIIALKNELARTAFVLIPHDAVDSRSFSLLHMHLKFSMQSDEHQSTQ